MDQINSDNEKFQKKSIVVSGNWSRSNHSIYLTTTKFMRLIEPSFSDIFWIRTNVNDNEKKLPNLSYIDLSFDNKKSGEINFFIFLQYQIKITLNIIKAIANHRVTHVIFCFGADLFVLPIIVSRIFRKNVILRIEGRPSIILYENLNERNKLKLFVFNILELLSYGFSNKIGLEYNEMEKKFLLKKYHKKITSMPMSIDIHKFNSEKEIAHRKYDIGFIGNLNQVKGIMEFVESISLINCQRKIKVIIIGNGECKEKVANLIYKFPLKGNVDLIEWIENDEIPHYLNDIKIIVIPSHKEGLPNILLESMACGCIVIASSAGGIPYIINDEINGFLLYKISPEIIAQKILKVLESINLNKISKSASVEIMNNFNREKIFEKYNDIF